MLYFQKITNLGQFWSVLQWKIVNFKALLSILLPFGLFYCRLAYFMAIWYIFPVLVCCTKKKSGNPDLYLVFKTQEIPPLLNPQTSAKMKI
jgi:hypothetical protein